jgi:hypothetical protein
VKKLIIVLLLPFFSCAQGGYIEFNGGIARLGSNYYDIELGPGASALIGKQFDVTNTPFLFDMQIGLAFPSLLTAKVGVGSLLYRKTGHFIYIHNYNYFKQISLGYLFHLRQVQSFSKKEVLVGVLVI